MAARNPTLTPDGSQGRSSSTIPRVPQLRNREHYPALIIGTGIAGLTLAQECLHMLGRRLLVLLELLAGGIEIHPALVGHGPAARDHAAEGNLVWTLEEVRSGGTPLTVRDLVTFDTGTGAVKPNVTISSSILLSAGLGIVANSNATVSGLISGSNGLTLAAGSSGSVLLSGLNTYTGPTVINGGTFRANTFGLINTDSSLGRGSVAGSAADLVFVDELEVRGRQAAIRVWAVGADESPQEHSSPVASSQS